MKNEIGKLEPCLLWNYFYELTQIPRISKHEEQAINYVLQQAKKIGLETFKDDIGNVIIRKPATIGYENRKGVILQSHIDMVPQKNSDKVHDFMKDPLSVFIQEGWVTADGTTLGADNGIGVAAGLAIMASKSIVHGPLELLITVDEEAGMGGAFALKQGVLSGNILLNLDSEDEGELYVGCAGGVNVNISFDVEKEIISDNYSVYEINLFGLKGGHSGLDIHRGRGNANKLIFRLLNSLSKDVAFRIVSVNAGNMRNAIPREAKVLVAVPVIQIEQLKEVVVTFQDVLLDELGSVEKDLKISIQASEKVETVWKSEFQKRVISAINGCVNGVIRMNDSVDGLVESSTNLAIVQSEKSVLQIKCLVRSSITSAMDDICMSLQSIFELAGGIVTFDGEYSGWQPNMQSEILSVMRTVYNNMYGVIPEVKAIHAGLECGILGREYPHWDMISFGPTIRYPHSPDEKVEIESVSKFWEFLIEVLKCTPGK